jgi:hypothetical protein
LANRDELARNRHILYAIIGRPRWHQGMKLLPNLDVGRTSLFKLGEVPPAPSFRLGLREETQGPEKGEAHEQPPKLMGSEPDRKKPRTQANGEAQ